MRTRRESTQAPISETLNDPAWLREQYVGKRFGAHEIGKMTGRAPSTVLYHLRRLGIPIRPSRVSRSEYCNAPWLAAHYFDREQYLEWCEDNERAPEPDGGHGLSTAGCGRLAGASRESIRRWLLKHRLARRPAHVSSAMTKRSACRFALDPDARAALQRFEAHDVVGDIEVGRSSIKVRYRTGLREHWGLQGRKQRRIMFPDDGWWVRTPASCLPHDGLQFLDAQSEPDDQRRFEYSAAELRQAGFLDRRILVHTLVDRLVSEGWLRISFPSAVLEDDLQRLLADVRPHALSAGYIRSQPGRPASGLPPGFRLALDARDWGPLGAPGMVTLEDAWRDPRRVYWALESVLRRREGLTREAIVHRLCCGEAEGTARKAGPLWEPPSFWMSVLRDVLDLGKLPVVFDLDPGCGSKAVAVGALKGAYVCPPGSGLSDTGPEWARVRDGDAFPEIVEDDGGVCSDVAIVDCDAAADFERAVQEYGVRCDRVVALLPWSQRERLLASVAGVRVIRHRPRPYRDDAVVAVWTQS